MKNTTARLGKLQRHRFEAARNSAEGEDFYDALSSEAVMEALGSALPVFRSRLYPPGQHCLFLLPKQ